MNQNNDDEYKLGFWSSQPFIDAANILVASDEPLRALKLLEGLPGYYRDHIPPEIQKVKDEILEKLATAHWYSKEPTVELSDPKELLETVKGMLRWEQIKTDVEDFNKIGLVPHIWDMASGGFWLPLCLRELGLKFTYDFIGMCHEMNQKAIKELGDIYRWRIPPNSPVISFMCEILEHLHFETDLKVEMLKAGYHNPDIIHISTPKFSFDTRIEKGNWRDHGTLGHLRTYTLRDFYSVCYKMFPGYQWLFLDSKILHARGCKNR